MSLRAHSVTLAEGKRTVAVAEADWILNAGRMFPYLGIGAALSSLLIASIACWRHAGERSLLPFVLLAFYLLSTLILV